MKKDLKAFTIADRLSRSNTLGHSRAFTMAEILISLTIIGIVAAITLPTLMTNINEKAWNAQRKALHARLAQAIGTMDKLNGFTDARAFVNEELANALTLTTVCADDKLSQCGIPTSFVRMDGTTGELPTGEDYIAGTRTANGESLYIDYNSECTEPLGTSFDGLDTVCVNFVYDLNGTKGPNTVGKDVGFITALYPTNSVVIAPMPAYISSAAYSLDDGEDAVFNYDSNTRLPNKNELVSIGFNSDLISEDFAQNTHWSSTVDTNDSSLAYYEEDAVMEAVDKSNRHGIVAITNDGSAPKSFNASAVLTEEEGCSEPEPSAECPKTEHYECIDSTWTCVKD